MFTGGQPSRPAVDHRRCPWATTLMGQLGSVLLPFEPGQQPGDDLLSGRAVDPVDVQACCLDPDATSVARQLHDDLGERCDDGTCLKIRPVVHKQTEWISDRIGNEIFGLNKRLTKSKWPAAILHKPSGKATVPAIVSDPMGSCRPARMRKFRKSLESLKSPSER